MLNGSTTTVTLVELKPGYQTL